MRRVCFYHAGCPDGFGAAWAVAQAWGDEADYVPRGHDSPLDPDGVAGAMVVFVDIAPSIELLSELANAAGQLVVLDHHLSSRDNFETEPVLLRSVRAQGHEVVFDLDHSGAVLAWRYFCGPKPVPELLRYVEDQDLWSWKLPQSAEVNAAISSYPRHFEVWSELAERPIEALALEGVPLVRARGVEVQQLAAGAHPLSVAGNRIEAVNATQHRSALGHALALRARFGKPWGCVYRIQAQRVDASLYSIGELDVSALAVRYGGGGHRNAAGFSVPLRDWLRDFV